MNPLLIGMVLRWVLAVVGTGAAATSSSVQTAPDVSSIISALPHDWQLGLGALATLASLAWSYAQKRGWIKAAEIAKAPVEEVTLS